MKDNAKVEIMNILSIIRWGFLALIIFLIVLAQFIKFNDFGYGTLAFCVLTFFGLNILINKHEEGKIRLAAKRKEADIQAALERKSGR